MTYAQYGSLADYFSQSGGTNSPGKSGGAGYSNDIGYGGYGGAGSGGTASGGSGSGTSTDSTQGGNASSGSGWISGAVSSTQSDKSNFITSFSQNFGGITNNQIIGSPGSVGANAPQTSSPSAPLVQGDSGGGSNLAIYIALATLAATIFLRR